MQEIFRILGTPNEEIFEGITSNEIFRAVKWTQFPGIRLRELIKEELIDDAGLDLLEKMLCYEPSKRITAR